MSVSGIANVQPFVQSQTDAPGSPAKAPVQAQGQCPPSAPGSSAPPAPANGDSDPGRSNPLTHVDVNV